MKRSLAGISFDLSLSSPLDRARDTTSIATCTQPRLLPAFGVPKNPKHSLNVMFSALAYSPLLVDKPTKKAYGYFQHKLGRYLKKWARQAVDEVVGKIKKAKHGYPIRVAIGGHAVCQNAFIWALLERLGIKDEQMPKVVTHYNLGEAEGLSVVLHQGAGAVTVGFIAPAIAIKS